MYTIVETPTFTNAAKTLWSEEERSEFCIFIATNPLAGDLCQSGAWQHTRAFVEGDQGELG